MTKTLSAKYKTLAGAQKRATFENAMAKGEWARGDKARLYHYTVTKDDAGNYRVVRNG